MKYFIISMLLLQGCSIRAIASIETGDAVAGKIKIEKEQAYDPESDNLLGTRRVLPGL